MLYTCSISAARQFPISDTLYCAPKEKAALEVSSQTVFTRGPTTLVQVQLHVNQRPLASSHWAGHHETDV